jgi:cytosine/adenosine deaminase-related metal-dependent hydrolase
VRRGVDAVGLRSVLAWEITDRLGPEVRDASLRETEAFLAGGQGGRCRAMVGAQASWALSDETLSAVSGLAAQHAVGVHIHVAESPHDERETRAKHGKGVIERLVQAGILGPKTLLAHCTHLSWEELSQAQEKGAWLVHNPRSNMDRAAGYAPAGKFGARKALGTDGQGEDLFAEAHVAWLKSMEAGAPIDPAKWLAGGQTLASGVFGLPLGPLEPGAAADLVVFDYPSAAPLADETVAAHVAGGRFSAHVWSVMVDGMWRLWDRQLLSFDWEATRAQAQELAAALWKRM